MGIKKLTVENAQIKTASVEVKTLTISGKQVTLAVFRQLPEESPIDDGGEDGETMGLKGVIWGRVNYHPDGCALMPPHLHIVWQDGEELKRGRVFITWAVAGRHFHRRGFKGSAAERWIISTSNDEWYVDTLNCDVAFRSVEMWENVLSHCLTEEGKPYEDVYNQRTHDHQALYLRLLKIDQLFIAV